jgi:hypothetical protein
VGHSHTQIVDNGLREIGLNREGDITVRRQRGVITAGYMQAATQEDYSDGYVLSYSDTKRTAQADGYALVRLSLANENNVIESKVIQ